MAEQEQTVDQQQEKAREKAEDDRYQRAEQQQAAYDDEYESRRETLSALALFQQDSVEQLAGGSRQNRRDYYQKLLSRLYIELRDLGASMLLDQLDAQLTQKHQGKCAMLVYSAVTQCYQMLVLDAPMADAANAVPDVFTAEREPMTWELLASYSADPELPVRASFTTRVRVLRSVSRLLYQARRDGRSAAPEEDALRARLQEYQLMAKMQDESLENAARQVEEANRKAEEARTGRAEEEIKPIKEKLLAEFEEKLKAQEAQFAQAGRAKFQEAFGQQQKAVRERMEDEARWAAQLFDDAGMQYDKLRQDFARMQEEQNARMQQWQTAIYQADTRMLGQCYVGMATKLGDAVDQAIAKLMKPEMSAEEAKPLLELRAVMLSQLTRLEYAMKRNGIPYKVVGGMKFFDRAEVKDMLAYLCVINNRADELRLQRIINNPPRGIGGKTLEMAQRQAAAAGVPLYTVVSDPYSYPSLEKSAAKLMAFTVVIEECAELLTTLSLPDFYEEVMLRTGYLKMLEEKDDVEARTRAAGPCSPDFSPADDVLAFAVS